MSENGEENKVRLNGMKEIKASNGHSFAAAKSRKHITTYKLSTLLFSFLY
jgi:hypothetical protein